MELEAKEAYKQAAERVVKALTEGVPPTQEDLELLINETPNSFVELHQWLNYCKLCVISGLLPVTGWRAKASLTAVQTNKVYIQLWGEEIRNNEEK